jgi:predicted RNA binding protein YcfA (HicA-like mRNA interferase family)
MKSYSSRAVIRCLTEDGWYEIGCVGDHHQFKHPTKPGKVTVTHPVKDIPLRTLKSIEKQAGLKFQYLSLC